jgi:hypothetical protein
MNALDADHANAIDGLNGGTYPLAAPIHLTTDTFRSDILEATLLTVDDDAIVGASGTGSLEVKSNLHVGTDGTGFLTAPRVVGATTFSDTVTATGTLTGLGSLVVGGNAFLIGQTQFSFQTQTAPLASHSFTNSDRGQIWFIEGTQGADFVYSFTGSFAAGQWFLFMHRAIDGHQVTVNGVVLTVTQSVFFVYNGTAWRHFCVNELFA